MEECVMLTEFPNHLRRIYFPLRSDKIIPKLSRLLIISSLEKFLEKNATSIKLKMLEIELDKKTWSEKERLIALGMFDLVLFPSQIGVISLDAIVVYVECHNPILGYSPKITFFSK